MNILLMNHYAGSRRYGMELRPYLLGKEWIKAGHSVRIVAASFSHLRQTQPLMTATVTWEKIDGIDYCWLSTPAYSGNGMGRAVNIFVFLLRFLRHHPEIVKGFSPDVVIASSTYPLDNAVVHRVARRFGALHVYEVHDLWPLSLIELAGMSPRHPFVLLMKWAEHYAYRHVDHVVSLLPNAELYMRENGLGENKYTFIPNGIEGPDDMPVSGGIPDLHADTLRRLKDRNMFLVCYAGGHAVSNALESFVRIAAYADSSRVALLLVGNGVEKLRLMTIARNNKYQNIYFFPPVPRESVQTLLARMDILYLGWQNKPIYRYGVSPNKLMDYMLAGKAIIHANNAGNDIVAESGCGISIPPEDPRAAADAIHQLMAMTDASRAKMGERGRQYVIHHFQNSELAKRFLALTSCEAAID